MTTLAVMGSTGSIGTQTLDIVRAEPDAYDVVALAASSSVDLVAEQAAEFRPDVVVLVDESRARELARQLPPGTELLTGTDGLAAASTDAQCVINGVVGFAGLPVTLATLEAGHRLGLANKESLISAGPVVQQVRSTPGAELIPVDSEHCALHQCLRANDVDERVHRLVLTASGGPFRGRTSAELAEVTVDDALAHPTWSMGPKITVDSSTLMNKGLEVIEAHELFGIAVDDIEVVVHPQSIVHSMVTYTDGATIAQLSLPDMRLCIGYALAYPDRLAHPFGAIDWRDLHRLDFELPDTATFPCLDLAFEAGRMGGTGPAWLNAANEEAVAAFLQGRIAWIDIAEVLKETLHSHDGTKADSLDAVLAADRRSRAVARTVVDRKADA
ncbi:MAG: 1-deoxy-D-xylulose-5-phosphate reductoisomerase [Acidimicrobiia bacterium]|nr:1-deoxy-D-xylulose-5-phosphate reductoisomerase [Acidimicrobiia bacterium]MDH5238015.1 1-deoxy-D-xylulose-5-phosphate reductoisomerase [Acidimicrobiia bacterium]